MYRKGSKMPDIKILTESELRNLVNLDIDTINCIESAFKTLAGGKVVMPPILSMGIHDFNGEVDVKTAYVPGIKSFAIKMSPGFFDNPKLGIPSTSGLMVLFSSKTGVLEALLLDNGYLTDIRTAAAGAVAARHLARDNASSACVIGSGNQAELQLKALNLVRPLKKAIIWGRDYDKASKLANKLSVEMNIQVISEKDIEKSVTISDIIITTTPSNKPLIKSDWLKSGQHITAMGSDQNNKCELEASCITKCSCYIPDFQAQTKILGELRPALEAGLISKDIKFHELGDVILDKEKGRKSDQDITIADLTGTGMQDTAIATFANERADKVGIGSKIKN